MKIEIDLDTIFRDEEGEPGESIEEAVRRQVTDRLTGDLRKRLFDRLDHQLSEVMRDQIGAVMKEKMPALMDDILNATYVPVSNYGQRAEPTTFRNEIIRSVAANMKYEPKNHSSDENAFTQAVKSVVTAQTKAIRDELTKQIDTQFAADALKTAVAKLAERLGLSKS
ncbi:MAG: hypothetical protein ACYC3L_00680 [Gemmatimonadaceae bacterium]